MAKDTKIDIDRTFKEKSDMFIKNVNSDMYFRSEIISDLLSFNWVNEIEFACPYIDNIVRNPRLTLINENDVVKIEKARKITVESIKDLAKHTQYIDEIDTQTNEVKPSKILILRREETFNIYENRFMYTLVKNLIRFVEKKEALLENYDTQNDKVLEYAASTNNGIERVTIELKIGSKEIPKGKKEEDFKKEIKQLKARVKKIKDYISSWQKSEFITSLEKARVSFVIPPIRKTNMILKNPNFQVATKLWEFLQAYEQKELNNSKEGLDTEGDNTIKGILDDSFLMNYFVLDSISSSKKEQKEKLSQYAVVMIKQQVQRVVSLLLNSGIDISEDEILSMISTEIKNEKSKIEIGSKDIKKKFKDAMEEYLEKTQNYL